MQSNIDKWDELITAYLDDKIDENEFAVIGLALANSDGFLLWMKENIPKVCSEDSWLNNKAWPYFLNI